MSNKPIVWTIIAVAVGFVTASGLSPSVPIARGGQEIPPGGRPGKIKSYFATSTVPTVTVIPSVPGINGFVVTDIVAKRGADSFILQLYEDNGGMLETRAELNMGLSQPQSYHFESGIVLTPGVVLKANAGLGSWSVTVSGYTF